MWFAVAEPGNLRAQLWSKDSNSSTPPRSASGAGKQRLNEAELHCRSLKTAAGSARISIVVASLIDTNILVYRFDPRFSEKQKVASDLLRDGLKKDSIRIPHQALVEFMAVVSRIQAGNQPLLPPDDARRETEEFLTQFTVLYPNSLVLRTALRGAATYHLSWFDAHLWAYAEHYCLEEIVSEDFEHGRMYGTVRIRNPFLH